jgi:fibronectin-binding autotransporter adhesin
MRPASPRVVTLRITALCLLAVLLTLTGLASGQTAAAPKRKLSQQSLFSQHPVAAVASAQRAKPNAQPPLTADSWTGASGGSWNTSTNWSAGVPTSSDAVTIGTSSTTVNLNTGAAGAAGSLTIDTSDILSISAETLTVSGATTNSGTITNSGTLNAQGALTNSGTLNENATMTAQSTISNTGTIAIGNGATMTVDGNISGAGTMSLNSTGNFTELILGANVTLSGGTLTLSNNSQNYIFGSTSLDQLTNQETIQGAGQIGHGQMTLVNSGTINANASAGMTIDANDGFTNTGTVEATGATLILQSMSMNNTGGTITATGGGIVNVSSTVVTGGTVSTSGASKVQLNNATIGGGTITNSATGTIEIASGTNALGGIINNSAGGLFEIDNGATLYLLNGTYSQLGTVQLNSTGNFTELVLGGNVTLSGGTVTLSNNSQNYIFGNVATDVLTNQETIQGAGQIGHGQMQLVNSGTINSDDSSGITLSANMGVTNTGTLEATNGSTLLISGSGIINNTGGTISANTGTITATSTTVDGGNITLTGASKLQLNTATIHGGSTITNSATGTIEIATGTNDLGGAINNSAGGLFEIDNGATLDLEGGTYSKLGTVQLNSTGNFTELVLNGNVTLTGGTLTLSNNSQNYIFGLVSTDTLTNEETIQGAGQIGHGQMQLINTGTINSNSSAGMTIAANQGITNTGTLEATNGSTLILSGSNIINNTGGTISANTGIINLSSTAIDGGNVTLTGASTFQMNTGTLHNGSTLTNSSAGTIEIATGTNVLGGTINNSAGGTFKIDNGATLDLEGGTYSQLGNVQLNSSGNFTELVLQDNVTLSGGTITLSNNSQNYIFGQVATDTLTNQETIQGAGQIGHGQMQLINSGTINSDDTAGMTISANLGVTNTGTIEATSGSTLIFSGSGTINNAGGTISANTGTINVTTSVVNGGNITLTGASALQMNTATIHDGSTITNSSTGTIEIATGTNVLGGAINNSAGGTFKIDNGATLELEGGTYSQLGTMQLNSSGNFTELIIEGNVTLSGGTLTLSANTQNYILGGNTFDVLTNKQTIQGAGQIGNGGMGLVNTGTINANASGNLVINVSNQNFNNTGGTLEASGATLTIEGPGTTYFTNDNESTNTLTGGTYIANGANILWNHGSATGITTLAASVTEESGGQLINTFNSGSTNMLAGLTSITSAGALTIGGTAFTDAGSFSNAGSLTLLSGESFTVASLAQISGGSLTAGTYVLDANLNLSGTAQTITTNAAALTLAGGTIENTSNSTNALAGLAVNSGKLTIGGAGNNVSTTATSFSNTGTLTINGGDSFTAAKLTQISGTTLSAGTFVLSGNLDLTTAGISVTKNSATLTLQGGTINSNGVNALAPLAGNTKSLTIAGSGNNVSTTAATFTNSGTVTVKTGDTFTLNGTGHNYTQSAGTTTVDGTLTATGITATGGSIFGAGTLNGNVSIGNATGTAATLNVGDSGKAGLLAITGTYTQLATGTMNASIGGLTSGTYSALSVSGTASLGGTLSVSIVNGLVLTSANIGTQFTILTSTGTLSGSFTNGTVTAGTDVFTVSYTGNSVVLTLTSVTGPTGSKNQAPATQVVMASTIRTTPTKTTTTKGKTPILISGLRHPVSGVTKNIRPVVVAAGWAPAIRPSNGILATGSESNNLRSWERIPVVSASHATPVAVVAPLPHVGKDNMAHSGTLSPSDLRVGQSHPIGMPSGWMGGPGNGRVPVKTLLPMLPRITR